MPARIARASSLAATHTSGTSELVSPACVPDLTYTHTWTSFFGAGALCLRAAFSCTRTVCLRLAVAPRWHVHTARSRSAPFQEPLSVHTHIHNSLFLPPPIFVNSRMARVACVVSVHRLCTYIHRHLLPLLSALSSSAGLQLSYLANARHLNRPKFLPSTCTVPSECCSFMLLDVRAVLFNSVCRGDACL